MIARGRTDGLGAHRASTATSGILVVRRRVRVGCPNCGSQDIEKPFFAGNPLPGSPPTQFGQVLKHQRCRRCKKFFVPKVPTWLFVPMVGAVFATAVFILYADLTTSRMAFAEWKTTLTNGKVMSVVLIVFASAALAQRR
jgi:hypothetical protein